MSSTFTDSRGRQWQIQLTPTTRERLSVVIGGDLDMQTIAEINLVTTTLFAWCFCADQAAAAGVTELDFTTSTDGIVAVEILSCILNEFADELPDHFAKVYREHSAVLRARVASRRAA